jgi:hypothetical protein
MSCPVACPVAWSHDRGIPCTYGLYGERVPANDCLLVSPRSSACPLGGVPDRLAVLPYSSWQGRGADFRPLACPLALSASRPHYLDSYSLLPAKEIQKRRRQGHGFGGEL